MTIKHVISDNGLVRWRQEIDEANHIITIVYQQAWVAEPRKFTAASSPAYAEQLAFILINIAANNWRYARKCEAKRLVGR